MYCKKCGAEISDKDKFCQNCGEVVDENKETSPKPELISKPERKKSNNKKGLLLGAIVSAIIIIGIIIVFAMPKEIEFEVKELSKILYTEECEQYYGDTLKVHGYLFRDTRSEGISNEQDGYYCLIDSVDALSDTNFEMILFKLDETIGDDVGTGSEVTITGKLDEESESGIIVAESIEIHKKEEMIYYTDLETIANDFEKYNGKKVMLYGRLVKRFEQADTALFDSVLDYSFRVNGMTEEEVAKCISNGSYVTLKGTINSAPSGIIGDNNEVIALDVIEFEYSNNNDFEYPEAMTVGEIYDYYWNNGEVVTIEGVYIKGGTASVPYSICDEKTMEFVKLNTSYFGVDLDKYCTSGEKCVITGYLYEDGTGYRLDVACIG